MGIWRKLPGIAGQWIFYTVLPCEFSHSAFLYSDSLKNNSWFSRDLFWLHMLVFEWLCHWFRLSFGMPSEVVLFWATLKSGPSASFNIWSLIPDPQTTCSGYTCWLRSLGWAISLPSTTSQFWNEAVTKIPSKGKDVRESVKGWCESSLAAYPLPNSVSRDSVKHRRTSIPGLFISMSHTVWWNENRAPVWL